MSSQLRLNLNDEEPNAGRRPKFPERIFLGIMPDVTAALQAEETLKKICEVNAIRGSRLCRGMVLGSRTCNCIRYVALLLGTDSKRI